MKLDECVNLNLIKTVAVYWGWNGSEGGSLRVNLNIFSSDDRDMMIVYRHTSRHWPGHADAIKKQRNKTKQKKLFDFTNIFVFKKLFKKIKQTAGRWENIIRTEGHGNQTKKKRIILQSRTADGRHWPLKSIIFLTKIELIFFFSSEIEEFFNSFIYGWSASVARWMGTDNQAKVAPNVRIKWEKHFICRLPASWALDKNRGKIVKCRHV